MDLQERRQYLGDVELCVCNGIITKSEGRELIREFNAKEREKYLTCWECGAPLSNNDLVKGAYKANTTMAWAFGKLKTLADMLEDKGEPWFAAELRKIAEAVRWLNY